MATVKQNIGNATGASSNATRYKKSAAVSARTFTDSRNQRTLRNQRRKKSNGGAGG